MKKINWLALLIVATGIAAGCSKQSSDNYDNGTNSMATNGSSLSSVSNTWQNTKEGGSNAWNAAKSGATNAWENTKEASSSAWQKTKQAFGAGGSTNEVSTNYFGYDYSMKDAFVAEAKTSLDSLDEQTTSLSNRMASATDSTKADLQQTWQDLNTKRADLATKYDNAKSATQDNWNDAKAAFAKSYYDLKADLKAGWDSVTSKM